MNLTDSPILLFALSFLAFWIAERIGTLIHRRWPMDADVREDFSVVLTATLTLLALIIGFSFSMAISHYDQRKNYEEGEANAIGTESVRADLLPAADAARLHTLLRNYLDLRIQFYQTRDSRQRQVDAATTQLQAELWNAARGPAAAQPSPLTALTVSGMNDVLNSQGYTQAAWWNRIPIAAWILLSVIAICCNLMVGYGARRPEAEAILFLVLPLVVAISFFLIADMDSPRGGVIHVRPQNLVSLSQTLRAHE